MKINIINPHFKNEMYKVFQLYSGSLNLKVFSVFYFIFICIISLLSIVLYDDSFYISLSLKVLATILMIFSILFAYHYHRYKRGKLKFDYSLYTLPNIGEEIVCIKGFYYKRFDDKIYPNTRRGYLGVFVTEFKKGDVLTVESYNFNNGKIVTHLKDENEQNIFLNDYIENLEYIKSKRLHRIEKLKKLNI